MARALECEVSRLVAPRVLVGSSLGALVALELARTVRVDALVLIAAGFGIKVDPAVLEVIAADSPGLSERMARGVVADRSDRARIALIARDFAARGQAVMLHHMQVLAAHRPEPLAAPPATLVLAGTRDPGVPLADQAELAIRCGGLLVPIADAGHLPYLERTEETVSWIRRAAGFAELRAGCLPPRTVAATELKSA
jgi:pimeloyl-ACP methyl ester carboxylesterase